VDTHLAYPAMEPRPAAASASVLAHWMGPLDANSAGFVHGGTVLKLCDEAAGLSAIRHSRCRVVTAAVDRMTFLVPIHVGELVTFKSQVNAGWRTSMEVGIRVEAENPRTGEVRHTNSAYFTMVALDDQGRPTEVPALEATSPEDRRREQEAQVRRRMRLDEREVLRRSRAAEGGVRG
jgi:acyl-CoA hydrolase